MNQINANMQRILLERMYQEYSDFIENLMHQPTEEIIRASYEKVFKEDIITVVEAGDISASHVRALLREQYPLEGCYQRWLDEDISYMEDLKICVEKHAESLMKCRDNNLER